MLLKLSTKFIFAFLFFISTYVFASVAGDVNKANGLYKQGKFDESLGLYQKALDRDDKSSVIKYDLGTALYKKGDYVKASEYLKQAAQDKDIKITPKADYNLGNVLYKSGILKEHTNLDEAIRSLQEALRQYVKCVKVDPKDSDAKFNLEFVKKEIERLKHKKQQQQRDNQQRQDQKQQQQKQQNQQGQSRQQEQEKQKNQQEKQQEKQQSAAETKVQKEKNARQAEKSQKEYDRKQAEDLLDEYQENEAPKKLLSYMPKKIDARPVLKDW